MILDCKTSVSLHILSQVNKPEHIYEHPVVFITTSRSLSLRTSGHSHSDLQSNFAVQPLKSHCQNSFRTPGHTSFRTPYFFVVFHLRTPSRTSCLFPHVRRS